LKVAIFTDTFVPQVNGVARTMGRLAGALSERDISCLVLSPDTGFEDNRGYDLYFSQGFKFLVYPECKIALPNFSELCIRLDLFKPDVLHLATEFSMGLCGLKYASRARIPVVGSYHTNLPQYLSYYGFSFLSVWVWKYLCWFHNQCLKNYCPSKETLKLLSTKGVRNLDIWGRGVDTALFSPLKRKPSFKVQVGAEDKTVLLYVGRLAPEKDLDILINAFRILNKYHRGIHLVITGEGPLSASLKREAPPGVTFTGYLHGEELAEAYASSDIFVFPSTTETYGNVILEAMASGLPVVASYSGGVKENLINFYNGLACRPQSCTDMVMAATALIEHEYLRKNLAAQARAHALTMSWDSVINKLIDGYAEVVAKNCRKTA